MPRKKKRIVKDSSTWIRRDTENLFDREKFYRDVRIYLFNCPLSLSRIGGQMGIGRMAMSRLFHGKSEKIDVNDFLVICHYMELDYSRYLIEF